MNLNKLYFSEDNHSYTIEAEQQYYSIVEHDSDGNRLEERDAWDIFVIETDPHGKGPDGACHEIISDITTEQKDNIMRIFFRLGTLTNKAFSH